MVKSSMLYGEVVYVIWWSRLCYMVKSSMLYGGVRLRILLITTNSVFKGIRVHNMNTYEGY